MGLDIYAGTLTRYYARNWKTAVQQWGERNGIQINMIRQNEKADEEVVPPEEILQDVTAWRDQLIMNLGDNLKEKPSWKEDIDETPYYTDKPDWDALAALLLYSVCKFTRQEVPEDFPKNYNVFDSEIYKGFKERKTIAFSLFDCDGWWLPINDAFMFQYTLPTGHQRVLATLGMLKVELQAINSLEWNADEETILRWSDEEGYPTDAVWGKDKKPQFLEKHDIYDTVSLAKFAFSILWQAVKHSEEHGTLIIYDF